MAAHGSGAGTGAPLVRPHGDVLGLAPGGTGQLSPTTVSCSQQPQAGEGWVTTRTPLLPPPRWRGDADLLRSSSGILCQGGWNWVWGQNELCASVSPCPPQRDASPRTGNQVPTGYGKGVAPPHRHPQQCPVPSPWQWLPLGCRVGKGQASPTMSALAVQILPGPVQGGGVRFLARRRGCDSCPGPLPVGGRQL